EPASAPTARWKLQGHLFTLRIALVFDGGKAARDGKAGQAGAAVKGELSDVGDATWNRDAGKAGFFERLVSDASDLQANGRLWNPVRDGHRTAGTGVCRDGDKPVIDSVSPGAVIVRVRLSLHHGGQRQQQQQPFKGTPKWTNERNELHIDFPMLLNHRPRLCASAPGIAKPDFKISGAPVRRLALPTLAFSRRAGHRTGGHCGSEEVRP